MSPANEARKRERVLILVKAVPNPSTQHGETVCCAGVTPDRQWRRLFPIRFRQLTEESKFNRWQWLSYEWRSPTTDRRSESRHVFEDTIAAADQMPTRERAEFLAPLVRPSAEAAAKDGHSLALVRPIETKFYWKEKSAAAIQEERDALGAVARQTSFIDKELAQLEPCPLDFRMKFRDASGSHDHSCHDWETSATFWKLGRSHGTKGALAHLDRTYNEDYPARGMVVALGTMAKRQNQWLLLGIIRLDETTQMQLLV